MRPFLCGADLNLKELAMLKTTRKIIETAAQADRIPMDRIRRGLRVMESESPPGADPPALCTQSEAARALNCSTCSIWRMLRDGELEAVKVRGKRMIRRSDVDAIIRGERPGLPADADVQSNL